MTKDKFKIIYFAETESTNIQASALLSDKKRKVPFAVRAEYQTRGRGLGPNTWHSEEAMNLLCSIAIRPERLNAAHQFYLSKIAALGLYDLIAPLTAEKTSIKWPNDILVGERKIAGILIDNTIQNNEVISSVIGIGLNVNQVDFPLFLPEATSMKTLSGKEYEVEEILELLLANFSFWYESITTWDADYIDHAYISALYRFNQKARYMAKGQEFEGTITGVEEDGRLKIQKSSGEALHFGFKEVEFK